MSPADSDRAFRHFDQELGAVRELLLTMASRAEEQVRAALTAVKHRDAQAAIHTIEADQKIDLLEIEIEERAISLLARQQPMAVDLRMLVAILKISNDVERVGDHAVNIAQCAKRLAEAFPIASLDEFDTMAEDDKVDRSNDAVFRVMLALMAENANAIVPGLQMMLVARNLERVADLATNLAEDVIYIVEARTIKHHVADHELEGEHDQ